MQQASSLARQSFAAVAGGLLVAAVVLVSSLPAAAAGWALTTEVVSGSVLPAATVGYGVGIQVTEQFELGVSYTRAGFRVAQSGQTITETVFSQPAVIARMRVRQGSPAPHVYGSVGFPSFEVRLGQVADSVSGTSYELGAGMQATLATGTELVASVGYQGTTLEKETVAFGTSGVVARLGVRIQL